MSWRIDDHPDGGLQITHLAAPRLTARWTTGVFPIDQVREGDFFWTDEGHGLDDAIHFYAFEWIDPSGDMDIEQLMQQAGMVVEGYITSA